MNSEIHFHDQLLRFYRAYKAAMPPGACHLEFLGDCWRIGWRGPTDAGIRTVSLKFDREFIDGTVGDIAFSGGYHAAIARHKIGLKAEEVPK